jgi:hypothetical protein
MVVGTDEAALLSLVTPDAITKVCRASSAPAYVDVELFCD